MDGKERGQKKTDDRRAMTTLGPRTLGSFNSTMNTFPEYTRYFKFDFEYIGVGTGGGGAAGARPPPNNFVGGGGGQNSLWPLQ